MAQKIIEIDFKLPANEYSALSLAYIGDAVYELYIRGRLMENSNIPPAKLHRAATHFVSAEAQFKASKHMEDMLTEEETSVFHRGRNAKSATSPKNADIIHYRHATGFEALLGYLYIKDDAQRLNFLMKEAYDFLRK